MKKFKVGQRCTIIDQIMICTEQDEFEPTCNETFVDCYDLEVKEVHEDCIVVRLINDDPEKPDYSGLFDTDWIIGEDEFDNLK